MESKSIEVSDEMLKQIAGGTAKAPVVYCPNCKSVIPVTTYQIITGNHITCQCCGLDLRINRPESSKTII